MGHLGGSTFSRCELSGSRPPTPSSDFVFYWVTRSEFRHVSSFFVDMESLIQTADRAMYEAKQTTGTSWRIVAPSAADDNPQRIQL